MLNTEVKCSWIFHSPIFYFHHLKVMLMVQLSIKGSGLWSFFYDQKRLHTVPQAILHCAGMAATPGCYMYNFALECNKIKLFCVGSLCWAAYIIFPCDSPIIITSLLIFITPHLSLLDLYHSHVTDKNTRYLSFVLILLKPQWKKFKFYDDSQFALTFQHLLLKQLFILTR